ncbi:MAG TPA: hypothetical protein VMR45_00060, partial [Patescibacteria group bacterium]|nr:hypothetical protein [Patescibacteria group bacterium]
VHDKLPVGEAAATAANLPRLTNHLAAISQESAQLSGLAEPLAAATDYVDHAAENLQTAQESIATYLGSIGAETGIAQQSSEQGASGKSPEQTTLDAYNSLLAKLEGGTGFDEQQSNQCINEIMQTAQDLIRDGRFKEAFNLRKKAANTHMTLPMLDRQKYPSGVNYAEIWPAELRRLTLQLAKSAEDQPGTTASHEIIDEILSDGSCLPAGDPGFAEFAAKNLAASMERTSAADTLVVEEWVQNIKSGVKLTNEVAAESDAAKLRRYNGYASSVRSLLRGAPSDVREHTARVIASFYDRSVFYEEFQGFASSPYPYETAVLEKVIQKDDGKSLLDALGFNGWKMNEAWAIANGGHSAGSRGIGIYMPRKEYISNNLHIICRLETEHKGGALELQKMLGIYNFARHDYPLLSDAYDLCTGDTLRNVTGPIAVEATVADDHNGGILAHKGLSVALHAQLKKKGGRLLPVEIQGSGDMTEIRDNLSALGMKRTPILLVKSHGGSNGIYTGGVRQDYRGMHTMITSENVKHGLGDFVRGIVDTNGTIVLLGCDNGKEAEGFAQVVADYTQRNVIASPDELAAKSVSIEVGPDGKVRPKVVFIDTTTRQEIAPVHFKPRPKT